MKPIIRCVGQIPVFYSYFQKGTSNLCLTLFVHNLCSGIHTHRGRQAQLTLLWGTKVNSGHIMKKIFHKLQCICALYVCQQESTPTLKELINALNEPKCTEK